MLPAMTLFLFIGGNTNGDQANAELKLNIFHLKKIALKLLSEC